MKFKKITEATADCRAYKLLTTIDQDPYHEECWSVYRRKAYKTHSSCNGRRKYIYRYEYRQYRSWKYNRKVQWKEKAVVVYN